MIKKNKNKGFSLAELIVVIAIMAVIAAVLVPSILQYVERSRAQKDDSAMAEVTNAIKIGMSDQDVFDEVMYYSCHGNASCYIDGENEPDTGKMITKTAQSNHQEQYTFDESARQKDEVRYNFAGNMRGVTITFKSTSGTFDIANAVINEDIRKDSGRIGTHDEVTYMNTTPAYDTNGTLGTMAKGTSGEHHLYDLVCSTVSETININSQTYRNSDYTVFIRMSSGGNEASQQDAITVYGQWNGTNLTPGNTDNTNDSDDPVIDDDPIIPDGEGSATFIDNDEPSGYKTLTWDELKLAENGTKYGYRASNITDTSIGNSSFVQCRRLTSITIPNSVTSIGHHAFYNCTGLTSIAIPNSVTSIADTAFFGCTSLTSIAIPDSVTSIGQQAFYNCPSLTNVYYTGTEEQWNVISISSYNSCLTNATIHYNYVP